MPAIPKPVYVHRFIINDGLFNTSSILYYTLTGASVFSQSITDAIGGDVAGQIADPISAILSTEAAIKGHQGKLYTPTQEFEVSSTGVFSDYLPTGQVTGDPLPTESVIEIQRRTGLPGRSNRGRIFFSGISEEAQLKGGLVQSGDTWAALPSLAAALLGHVTSGAITLTPAHWDRKNNALRSVTAWRVMDKLLSRRDRRRHLDPQPIS
jgi:hypothetical protein